LGPRYPGSSAIEKTRHLVASELLPTDNWIVKYQNFSKTWDDEDICLVNIIYSPKSINLTQPYFIPQKGENLSLELMMGPQELQ
jgi:hypothetical protein